jgi:hypothetical protein
VEDHGRPVIVIKKEAVKYWQLYIKKGKDELRILKKIEMAEKNE